MTEDEFETLEGQPCPFCMHPTLTLSETTRDIPFFGICHIFSMSCSTCKAHKADVEAESSNPPTKYTLDIESEQDMSIRVVKSSTCTVRVPYVGDIEAGEASNGYITNVEGILKRIQQQVENLREAAEDESERKKAKNVLKKLTRIMWGQEKAKLVLEDPEGNSAIISPKVKKEKLK